MSRVSSAVICSVVLGLVASTAACRVSVETKTRFTEANIVKSDTADWTGQPITIQIEGSGVVVNGGLNVEASTDPSFTKISVNARAVAYAFDANKADAQLSIDDVKAGLTITNTQDGIKVFCPHGGSHGGSNSGESGCELTNIIVPAGTDVRKLNLTVTSGNGDVVLKLLPARLSNLQVSASGAANDINAEVGSSALSVGATISLVSHEAGDVTLKVPSDFSSDTIQFVSDAGKFTNPSYPLTATDGTVGHGTPGAGFKSIKLDSESFAGESGQVNLQ